MRRTETFSFIAPSSTRSYDDDNWRVTEAEYIKVWRAAVEKLARRKVKVSDVSYDVEVDWTPMLRRHERHFSAMRYIHAKRTEFHARILKARFPQRPSNIKIAVTANSKNEGIFPYIAESVIYDIFIIMNIAAPGCCNFYKAELVGSDAKREISLPSGEFELGVLPPIPNRKLPSIAFIPLQDVVSWYDSVRVGVKQVPTNATERAIFTLLHLARLDIDPVSIVWFFYALESLLKTRVGENFGSIVRRLSLLLNLSPEDAIGLKKQLRILYDHRSAIVHGGFKVMHPMNVDGLDDTLSSHIGDLLSASAYAHVVLVSAFQRMALNNWPELFFEETIAGPDRTA